MKANEDSSISDNLRIAIDIGGTFTDLVLLRDEQVVSTAKLLTTPLAPAEAVIEGARQLLSKFDAGRVVEAVHGTTLVSNALIERKGARTALITTAGFRDVLEAGTEQRYDLYDLFIDLPEPLVPRRLRLEVPERILSDGTIDVAITVEDVFEVLEHALDAGAESVAVCFLHSYINPEHEEIVRAVANDRFPRLFISLSNEVSPEIGEYQRTSTTTANAYVQTLIGGYLSLLEDRMAGLGMRCPLRVMLSTGGLTTPEVARTFPVRLAESGPAAGVLGAAFLGGASNATPVVAFDMGGTTAKAALVESGEPLIANELEVARMYRFTKGSGIPLRIPVVDMIEIGAGGGSIAKVGTFDLPEVGPESASSVPGPACYDMGGEWPTVTDADLILGYLNPDYFLGGDMRLSLDRAMVALGILGNELGLSTEQAASAVHRVVNENMASATRMHAIERGRDIRRYTLVATGGAGPVHAWGVAQTLGIEKIVFPPRAGVASAFGMLTAPSSFESARSMPMSTSDIDWLEVRSAVREMELACASRLGESGIDDTTTGLFVDARYQGQGAWVTVPLGPSLDDDPLTQVTTAFDREYRRLYGTTPDHVSPELLTWRVRVRGPRPSPRISPLQLAAGVKLKDQRSVWFADTGYVITDVYDRYSLTSGSRFSGPAIVEERESTVVVGPGGHCQVAENGSILVEVRGS